MVPYFRLHSGVTWSAPNIPLPGPTPQRASAIWGMVQGLHFMDLKSPAGNSNLQPGFGDSEFRAMKISYLMSHSHQAWVVKKKKKSLEPQLCFRYVSKIFRHL